jgi:hypothetical protein
LAAAALALLAVGAKTPEPRRIALRFSESITAVPALEKLADRAKGRGIELQEAPEGSPAPRGFDVAHVSALPVPEKLKAQLARFPATFEAAAFTFDGRTFSGKDDALVLVDPGKPAETFVIGATESTAIEVAAAWLLDRPQRPADFQVVSGELTRDGRFVAKDGRLAIDPATDRDRIAAREQYYKALRRERRGPVEWEFREADAPAIARFQEAAAKWAGKKGFTVRVFPDGAAKALYTGSSRPADLVEENGKLVLEVDASTPGEPELVEPVFAAAGLAAANPALLARRTLLLAAGARRVGTWWGRDVRTFAAFTHAAWVEPTLEEVVRSSEDASPILTIGAAASWLDAGVRLESEAVVEKAMTDPEGVLATKLNRWREAAWRQSVKPPARRPLPEGFLRGVSYTMTNTLDEGYATLASLATLTRLKGLAVNSIAVQPFALARERGVLFMHRSARGETDEAVLRAIVNARALGMTAMVQPRLWADGGASVGDLAMPDEKAWRAWFEAYRRYVVHQAVVAEAGGAALFCVGTGLTKTESHDKQWRDVIAAVHLGTGAAVVYSASSAAAAPNITFWEGLDAIGVEFTDPIARAEKAKDAELEEGVRRAVRPVADLAARAGKPVIFTGAGYAAVRGSFMAPRDEDLGRPAGGEDAARAIAAVFRALGKEPWWKGVYWAKASSDGKPAAAGERGLNFLGAPAEKAIGDGFRRLSAP